VLSGTLRCTLAVGAAPQPATKTAATAIATTRRPISHRMTCPFSRRTVTSWHAPAGLSGRPADPATARWFASAHAARHPPLSLESAGTPRFGSAAQAAAAVSHLAANGPEILPAAGYEINHVIGLELANRE
jgi:hypothetical protein